MFKKEIFKLSVKSDDFSKIFAKDLKVEIRITQSDAKSKIFRNFLGVIPDDVVDALKNTKVYVFKGSSYEESDLRHNNFGEEYNMRFIYPEMDDECKKVINTLFFHPLDFTWKKDPKLKGYPSEAVVLYANRLYPNFVSSALCGKTSGYVTGTVEFRVTKK